jgi:hypothetical protein
MSLSADFDLTKEDIDRLKEAVVKTCTKVVHTAWKQEAKDNLRSTRAQYLNSIIVGEVGRFTNVITLVGQLPNMIEQGVDPFDMKLGFENSSKRTNTESKDGELGWYLTIPFSWAQPGSLGESTKFSAVLPSDVSKALNTKHKAEGGGKTTLNLSDIPDEFRIPQKRSEISLLSGSLVPEYQHKHSVYEGLQKVPGLVTSFRRVSNNSDDLSWVHKGFQAYNLADKALEKAKIPEVVGDVIDAFLDQTLG